MPISSRSLHCRLCLAPAEVFFKGRHGEYFECSVCRGVFLSPEYHLDAEAERARYEAHNNDVTDAGYQAFVSPVINYVRRSYDTNALGLDFGCGPGPAISHVLRNAGYRLELYDPFFCNEEAVLKIKYDYIVCCEVIEHYRSPAEEFRRLRSYLKPGGQLICMTDLLTDDTDFPNWYYKDDPTHVFFYRDETVEYISLEFGFAGRATDGRVTVFHNH